MRVKTSSEWGRVTYGGLRKAWRRGAARRVWPEENHGMEERPHSVAERDAGLCGPVEDVKADLMFGARLGRRDKKKALRGAPEQVHLSRQ